jgi:hypothetical protein
MTSWPALIPSDSNDNQDNAASASPEEIIAIAKSVGFLERRPTTSSTLFFIDNPSYGTPPCRINIYYTTRSIMTHLHHPSSASTNELWRSNAYDTLEELRELFVNPRRHTGKGYRNATKAVRGCVACGEMKTKLQFSRNQWTKGPDVNKCIDCVKESLANASTGTSASTSTVPLDPEEEEMYSNLISGLENTTLNDNHVDSNAVTDLIGSVAGLTLDNLKTHNQITNNTNPGGGHAPMERRQFNCPACPHHGRGAFVFFKRVPAMKPLVKCPKCKRASRGKCKRLYPIPKGSEKGYGLYKCGKCFDFWGSRRAVANIGQECHGCKEKHGESGVMVTPFRLEVFQPKGTGGGGGGGGRRVPREPIGEDQVDEREYGDADAFRNASGGAGADGAIDASYEMVPRESNNDNRSDSSSVVGLTRTRAPSGYQHSCSGCARGLCKNRKVPISETHDVSDGNTVSTRNSIVTNSSVDKSDYIDRDLDFEELLE